MGGLAEETAVNGKREEPPTALVPSRPFPMGWNANPNKTSWEEHTPATEPAAREGSQWALLPLKRCLCGHAGLSSVHKGLLGTAA